MLGLDPRFQDVLLSVVAAWAPWEVTEAMFMFPVCSPVSPQSPASASPGPGAEPQSEASERLMLSAEAGPCSVTLIPSHRQHSLPRGPRVWRTRVI